MGTVSPMELQNTSTSDRARTLLALKRIPHARVAEAFSKTPASVSRKMCGRVPFTVEELRTLAKLLDVTVSDLLGDSEQVAP